MNLILRPRPPHQLDHGQANLIEVIKQVLTGIGSLAQTAVLSPLLYVQSLRTVTESERQWTHPDSPPPFLKHVDKALSRDSTASAHRPIARRKNAIPVHTREILQAVFRFRRMLYIEG